MEEHISNSALDRLPAVIRGLNEIDQKTYIYLRLRKSEDEISRLLNLSIEEAKEKIKKVRSDLIKAGQIDLIEDPVYVSINPDNPDMPELPLAAKEIDVDKKLIIKEFLSFLKQAISDLPDSQVQLLKLRHKHKMSAKDILGLCRKLNLSLIPGKEILELKEQDIFYALNTARKDVLRRLRMRYGEENSFGMENLKYIFDEIGA